MTLKDSRRAHVVGLGLIGCSVALALTKNGWRVSGEDLESDILTKAQAAGLVEGSFDDECELVIIATPAGSVIEVAQKFLSASLSSSLIVTDVAGVKSTIAEAIVDARFIPGHPMAGSERRGLEGAREDLFVGCTWVLTPRESTTPESYQALHRTLRDLGAHVTALAAPDHDRLVALASHVPHLIAGALMNEAAEVAEHDAVLLQLAAGGFRDMTRVAAGDPHIWPDVLLENRVAVIDTLRDLEDRLNSVRKLLEDGLRDSLVEVLSRASQARRELPGRALDNAQLARLRVDVSDQPGVLATVTQTASEMLVNIFDIEIAHDIEGASGTLLLAVDRDRIDDFELSLTQQGFRVGRE